MNDLKNIITLRTGGKRYAIDLYDLDGVEWRDAKQATGLKQQELLEAALGDRDFEALAALIWIWRRRTELTLTYEAVLSALTYRRIIEPVPGDEPEHETEDDKPDPPD